MTNRKKIFYYSHVDWFWIKQRPHHIPELLSRYYTITFYSNIRALQAFRKDEFYKHNSNDNLNKRKIEYSKHFKVLRKSVWFPRSISEKTHNHIKKIVTHSSSRKADLIWLTHPTQYSFVRDIIKQKPLVYDCMDDHVNFNIPEEEKKRIIKDEKELIERSDIIFTSSAQLKENLLKKNNTIEKKTFIVPNGVDDRLFDPFNCPDVKDDTFNTILKRGKKIAGYIGSISEWIDWEALGYVADALKDEMDLVLIGPVWDTQVPEIDNIFLLGPRPYYHIPFYLTKFNVALIPFKPSKLTESVNPVKIYEYMAMGLHSVVLRYAEIDKLKLDVSRYSSKEDLLKKVAHGINNLPTKEQIQNRRKSIQNETWEKRVEYINNKLEKFW
jgi:glycosyltransferase involved in cell wall biosynthesis